jgi:predicted nucleotidyltransferase
MDSARSGAVERLAHDLALLLDRLVTELKKLYGERFRGLVHYGSYARGGADEGSDVDVLLLLEGDVNTARELLNVAQAKWALALEAGYIVSLLTVNVETYRDSQQPLSRNARNEGVTLP